MKDILTLILAGGEGTRLKPLTRDRAKPAVPFGGLYRIIDFTLSNCINSGLRRILVLTQYKARSLDRHLRLGWNFLSPEMGEYVDILPPQQRIDEHWYKGTADAIYQNIYSIEKEEPRYVLILAGDHIYKMNYGEMIQSHLENKAEATIAALPVGEAEATSCGVMRIDSSGRVIDFEEKPKTPEKLDRVRTDPVWLERFGIKAAGREFLASMGIYLFNRATLVQLLADGNATDFGHEVFPRAIANHPVQTHLFDGYWEDIGTVGAFHKANIDLSRDDPPFDFTFGDNPVFTRPRYLPCSRILGATVTNSLISDGCVIGRGSVVENSVIGVRAQIAENVTIRNTYIIGADLYEQPRHLADNARAGRPNFGVGANSVIENAIIDKNARIGRDVRVVNAAGVVESEEAPHYVIRDRIVVIPKHTILPDGATI